MTESFRVLVGYATAAGSTQEIAERIAGRLERAADEVVVRPVGPDLDPARFNALVLGSAVHGMSWLPPALDFLRRAASTTGHCPTWCFSVGGLAPGPGRAGRLSGQELRRIEQGFPTGFRPLEHRIFGGVVQTAGVPWYGRLFWRAAGGQPGDQRDWPAIEAWADTIAAELESRRTAPSSRADRSLISDAEGR
ncbi:flavodoxin domain-containing protein [Blastococcus atacamensis]|uniref:flavodoxin domain-containing protein n=1 Tax=Blastococcus atacamensis TaxID=2070508 RepID=UPI000CEBCC70|nr:flavodoxin domain-containing protein [Blastococcus atacamensis]